jgi:hypothetical protein
MLSNSEHPCVATRDTVDNTLSRHRCVDSCSPIAACAIVIACVPRLGGGSRKRIGPLHANGVLDSSFAPVTVADVRGSRTRGTGLHQSIASPCVVITVAHISELRGAVAWLE